MDKEIIEACKQGERKATEKIFHAYKSKMKAWCYSYSKSDFDTEEILQEAFIKLFTHIKRYEYSGSFDGWVRKIVVNTAINQYRKNLKFKDQVGYEEIERQGADDVGIIERLSVEELHTHIRNMPDGYRMVFVMFAIEGYSHKEIAELLDIQENTSSSQYAKSKKYLINILQKTGVLNNGR